MKSSPRMLLLYVWWYFLCACAASSQAANADVRTKLPAPRAAYFVETVEKRVHGRALEQVSKEVCHWNSVSESCYPSIWGRHWLVSLADSRVAHYLAQFLECRACNTQRSCESNERCRWRHGACHVSHEIFRDFFSSSCLEAVEHIVQDRAGYRECGEALTEAACSSTERCYWHEANCRFDKWKYYHGIPTVGFYPDGFEELYAAFEAHILSYAEGNGHLNVSSDVLNVEAPRFPCPRGYAKVECDYVRAFEQYIAQGIYCRMEYGSLLQLRRCEQDALCVADPANRENLCMASPDLLLVAQRRGEMVFANAVEHPEARLYEQKWATCLNCTDEDACHGEGDCSWDATLGHCYLSYAWIQRQIYRLVGQSKDQVCRYFAIDGVAGCLDIEDRQRCVDDHRCYYSDYDSNSYCGGSAIGEVAFVLDAAGLGAALPQAMELCEAADSLNRCQTTRFDALDIPASTKSAEWNDDGAFQADFLDDLDDAVIDYALESEIAPELFEGPPLSKGD